MEVSDIYGEFRPVLESIKNEFEQRIADYTAKEYDKTGKKIYEHLIARVKSEKSMKEKCLRKGYPPTPHTAMKLLRDSIGIRIICSFIDDIYSNIEKIRSFPDCRIIEEKDYGQFFSVYRYCLLSCIRDTCICFFKTRCKACCREL